MSECDRVGVGTEQGRGKEFPGEGPVPRQKGTSKRLGPTLSPPSPVKRRGNLDLAYERRRLRKTNRVEGQRQKYKRRECDRHTSCRVFYERKLSTTVLLVK